MEPIASIPILSKSSGAIYMINVFSNPYFTCSCPAGTNSQMCKHVQAILDKDISWLDRDALGAEKAWEKAIQTLESSDIKEKLAEYMGKIADIEKDIARQKKEMAKLKKAMARIIIEGGSPSRL